MKKYISVFCLLTILSQVNASSEFEFYKLNKTDIEKTLGLTKQQQTNAFNDFSSSQTGAGWRAFGMGSSRNDIFSARQYLSYDFSYETCHDLSVDIFYSQNQPDFVKNVVSEEYNRRPHLGGFGPYLGVVVDRANRVFSNNRLFLSGEILGEDTGSYDVEGIKMEMRKDGPDRNPPVEISPTGVRTWSFCFRHVASFVQGDMGFVIEAQKSRNSTSDFNLMFLAETTARILNRKRTSALALERMQSLISGLTPQGILHSLQVKLDNYKDHFKKGEYDTALNIINAFLNELSAQRGKHVSETTYQALKTQAETMIQATNFLMNQGANPTVPALTPTNQPKK